MCGEVVPDALGLVAFYALSQEHEQLVAEKGRLTASPEWMAITILLEKETLSLSGQLEIRKEKNYAKLNR